MSKVLFFGDSEICPIYKINERINKFSVYQINMKKEVLMDGENGLEYLEEEQQEQYREYIDLINFRKLRYEKVSCGKKSGYILDNKGEIWTFGRNDKGQLGIECEKQIQGEQKDLVWKVPINLNRLRLEKQLKFINMYVGDKFVYGMHQQGKVYGWGDNKYGTIHKDIFYKYKEKYFNPKNITKMMKYENKKEEVKVKQMDVNDIQDIQCSFKYTVFMQHNQLYVHGKDKYSRLGIGPNIERSINIIRIPFDNSVKVMGVSCGYKHCLAWDIQGKIYSWGDANNGKLGHKKLENSYNYIVNYPIVIECLSDKLCIQASCGYEHSVMLDSKGHIYQWGKVKKKEKTEYQKLKTIQEQFNQTFTLKQTESVRGKILGNYDNGITFLDKKLINQKKNDDDQFDFLRPQRLLQEDDIFIAKINTYGSQNCAIDTYGQLYLWGLNTNNSLGLRNFFTLKQPVQCLLLQNYQVVDFSFGNNFGLAIVSKRKNYQVSKNVMHQYLQQQGERVTEKISYYEKGQQDYQRQLNSINLQQVYLENTKLYYEQQLRQKKQQEMLQKSKAKYSIKEKVVNRRFIIEHISDKQQEQRLIDQSKVDWKNATETGLEQNTDRSNQTFDKSNLQHIRNSQTSQLEQECKELKDKMAAKVIKTDHSYGQTQSTKYINTLSDDYDLQNVIGPNLKKNMKLFISTKMSKESIQGIQKYDKVEKDLHQKFKRDFFNQEYKNDKLEQIKVKKKIREYKRTQVIMKKTNIDIMNSVQNYKRTEGRGEKIKMRQYCTDVKKNMVKSMSCINGMYQIIKIVKELTAEYLKDYQMYAMYISKIKFIQRYYIKQKFIRMGKLRWPTCIQTFHHLLKRLIIMKRIIQKRKYVKIIKKRLMQADIKFRLRIEMMNYLNNLRTCQNQIPIILTKNRELILNLKKSFDGYVQEHFLLQKQDDLNVFENFMYNKLEKEQPFYQKQSSKIKKKTTLAKQQYVQDKVDEEDQVIILRKQIMKEIQPFFANIQEQLVSKNVGIGRRAKIITKKTAHIVKKNMINQRSDKRLSTLQDYLQKENELKIELQNYISSQYVRKGTKKRSIDITDQDIQNKEVYESNIDNILLYSTHRNLYSLPKIHQITITNRKMFYRDLQSFVEIEVRSKDLVIKKFIKQKKLHFMKSLQTYKQNMKSFIKQNQQEINLMKARLMLKLTKEQVAKVNQKEELEINIKRSKNHSDEQIVRDHLPFQKFNYRIASSLVGAPCRPNLKIELSYDEFKKCFEKYFYSVKSRFGKQFNDILEKKFIRS